MPSKKRLMTALPALISLVIIGSVSAQEIAAPHFILGLNVAHDDNISRDNTQKESDLILGLNGALTYRNSGHWYNLNANYTSTRKRYNQGSYEDQQNTNGSGSLILGTASSPITWTFSNNEQESTLNLLAADTPDNKSQRSTYTSGPTLRLRPTKRDTFKLSHTTSKTTISSSIADRESDQTSLSWNHASSNLLQLSFGGTQSTISSTIEAIPEFRNEFEQQRVYFNLNRRLNNGSISLQYGQTSVTAIDDSETTGNEYQMSLNLGRFSWGAQRSISDSGADSGFVGTSTTPSSTIGDSAFALRIRTNYNLSYSLPPILRNMTVRMTAQHSKDIQISDRTLRYSTTGSLSASKPINNRLTVNFSGSLTKGETGVKDSLVDRDQRRFQIGLSYAITENSSANCSATQYVGSETINADDYKSNRLDCGFKIDIF